MSVDDAGRTAREFVVFCDGCEEGGNVEFARRGRVVARLLLDAVDASDAERSARIALQTRCECQQELLGKRVYDELARSVA